MTSTMLAALRALRDCGVVRAHPGHPGYGGLSASGYAAGRRCRVGEKWLIDYHLTTNGRVAAAALAPNPGGTRTCA